MLTSTHEAVGLHVPRTSEEWNKSVDTELLRQGLGRRTLGARFSSCEFMDPNLFESGGRRLVGEAGIEPATPSLEGSCSIQLSYSPACFDCMRAGCASIHRNTEKTHPCCAPAMHGWVLGYDFRAAMASSRAVLRVLTQSPVARNSMQMTRLYFNSASLR